MPREHDRRGAARAGGERGRCCVCRRVLRGACVHAQWLDDSAADVATRVAEAVPIPAGSGISVLDNGPLVLEAGDQFQAKASAAGDLEISLAISEIT